MTGYVVPGIVDFRSVAVATPQVRDVMKRSSAAGPSLAFAEAVEFAKLDSQTHYAIKQSIRPEAVAVFRRAIDEFVSFGFDDGLPVPAGSRNSQRG